MGFIHQKKTITKFTTNGSATEFILSLFRQGLRDILRQANNIIRKRNISEDFVAPIDHTRHGTSNSFWVTLIQHIRQAQIGITCTLRGSIGLLSFSNHYLGNIKNGSEKPLFDGRRAHNHDGLGRVLF